MSSMFAGVTIAIIWGLIVWGLLHLFLKISWKLHVKRCQDPDHFRHYDIAGHHYGA